MNCKRSSEPKGRIKIKNRLISTDSSNKNESKSHTSKIAVLFIALIILAQIASVAEAGFIDYINIFNKNTRKATNTTKNINYNSQNLPILEAVEISKDAKGGGNLQIERDGVLIASIGPSGTPADNKEKQRDYTDIYVVKEGDTLSEIADMFDISIETIKITNNIKGPIKPGQKLTILPVSGVMYTIKRGGTLKDVVKNYARNEKEYEEILKDAIKINKLDPEKWLDKGTVVIIPDAVPNIENIKENKKYKASVLTRKNKNNIKLSSGFLIRPVKGGIKTQGRHGYNAIDIGVPVGTPVYASASGKIVRAKSSGWNYGYGKYIMISHPNGVKTLYAHLSEVYVHTGQYVGKGEIIGKTGNTGRSTGPHLHFEVRGAKNPF